MYIFLHTSFYIRTCVYTSFLLQKEIRKLKVINVPTEGEGIQGGQEREGTSDGDT